MKFEDTIKKISGFVAGLLIFFIGAGMYLNLKGFIMSPDGRPVLVKEARAAANPKEADGLAEKIAANVNVILPKGHPVGSKDAPISIYEYSSFGCYHCSDFHLETLPKLQKDFIDSGKVKLVFVDFPLDSKSMMAAMIADCMPEKNYHEFIKLLFKKQRDWGLSLRTEKLLAEYASLNGLSKEEVAKCLKNEKLAQNIIEERQQAIEKLNVQGTPALLVVSKDGKEVIHGAPDYDLLKAFLEKKLANK